MHVDLRRRRQVTVFARSRLAVKGWSSGGLRSTRMVTLGDMDCGAFAWAARVPRLSAAEQGLPVVALDPSPWLLDIVVSFSVPGRGVWTHVLAHRGAGFGKDFLGAERTPELCSEASEQASTGG